MQVVSIFKDLYKSKDVPYLLSLDKILNRIKIGKSKPLIDLIRTAKTKEQRDNLKKGLPCILFAGEFTERSKNGLKNHSGLMVVDFDKYPSQDSMIQDLQLLKQNKHFVSLFISPSGNGIKGVVKIPKCNKIDHERYFKAFQREYNYLYFDKSNCNVDRVCYESYDPNININFDAETYEPILIDEGFTISERVPIIPVSNEDFIINKIINFDWKKDFTDGQRNNFLFDLAGAFCEYGINEDHAIGYILNNVVIGEFSENEAKNTIKSSYKRRQFNSKFFEDFNKIDLIKSDFNKGKKYVLEKHKIDEVVYSEIKEAIEHDDFWYINEKNKVQINSLKYKIFLERNGFKKYFPNDNQKPTWIHVNSNKVKEITIEKIKDFVLDYLLEKKEIDVWNYCASFNNLFSENYLLMLESIELMLLKDTKDKSFIAYKNGILEVTKDSISLIDFIDVDGYIFDSRIIKRDFIQSKKTDNDYKTFIKNISNNNPLPFECVIGYMLSTYKNKMNNKAIILNDEVITENPEGGTGKGLFIQGIKNIRKTHIIDGKSYNDKANFQNQSVSLDDEIVVFDDVPKNFNFENIFSLITEGMTIRHLYKDPVKLNVEQSPKILIGTNYAIKGEGNSHDRRRHELELSQYYGKKLTPYDEFKKQLFDDWSLNEFQNFDNYMVFCLQQYLNLGLVNQNAKNIKMRKLIAETSFEFYEFASDLNNLPIGQRNDKSIYFNNFINEYKDFQKWLTRKKFNIWIQKYSNFIEREYKQGTTQGMHWFMIEGDNGIVIDDNEMPF